MLDSYTRRALLTRLLAEPGAAEASHLVVAGLVAGLLWGHLPQALLFTWLGGVVLLAVIRVVVRRRLGRVQRTLAQTPTLLRFSIVAVALAWGLGAYVAAPFLAVRELALLMVVFCGLAAAATATLLGDPPAYYGYVAALLGPLAIGVLGGNDRREMAIAFVLLVLYGAVMVMLFRRLHRVLLGSVASARSLAASQAQAERERRFLDALIASAPTAITVLEDGNRISRVNPAFERMFGYTGDESIGQSIDALVVPASQQGPAAELAGRVAAGRSVTVDGERHRKDGSIVYVRISAAPVPGEGSTLVVYDDITDAKLAELQLRESEQRWFQTLEGMPVGILVVDQRGRPLFTNAVAKQLLGRGVVELESADRISESYQVFVAGTPQLYPTERLPVLRALRGEHSRVDDMEVRRPDATVNLEVFASPITDSRGEVVFGVATFTDITERRRRAERTRARNAVVRVLAGAGADDAALQGVLRVVCESFGWDAGAMWRMDRGAGVLHLAGFWHGDHPEALALYNASRDLRFRPGDGIPGRVWAGQGPVWFADFGASAAPPRAAAAGTLKSAIGLPLRVAGEAVGVLEFFGTSMRRPEPEQFDTLEGIASQVGQALERHDAELARREAETQYRQLVEAASDLVWRTDREGRVAFLNRAAQEFYGMAVHELSGRQFIELSDGESRQADREMFARVMSGDELTDYETVHRHASGARRHLSTSARPIRDATGTIIGVQGIARDVTERVAAHEALEAARDAAEQAAAARSAFLANMSHEIRTPLNGVLGMAELLLDSDLSDGDRRSVELIVASGESLLGIINDILDFSKIEAQLMDIESVEFDLPALVESTARLLMPTANAKGLEVVSDIAETVPQYVNGDPTRLRQVITNLLGNAVKFTSEGEVVIRVVPMADAPDRLRIGVRDTGPGIPPAKQDAIFEPFRQADATTTRRHGGTGLGLSISRRLVSLMGGTLTVESAVGEGSEFSFDLRLPPTAGAPAEPGARADLSGARVLVADDNPTNRHVMQRVLQRAGCAVDEAPDGRAALAALAGASARRVPYQLLVTDLFMPEMDGFDLVSAMREESALRDTPVVMLSSAVRRGDHERARGLEVSALLLKPVGRTDLVEAASRALGLTPSAPRRHTGQHIAVTEAGRGLHVLLAEDNVVNQEVAATMLRRRGHSVDVVGNGRLAVEAVCGARYDLVLMDLQMPELDGFQAVAEIRALPAGRSLPVVAITANAMLGERERCLAAGMDGYLSKPYKPHELFSVVESLGGGAGPGDSAPSGDSADEGSGAAVNVDAFRAEMRAAGVEAAVAGILDVFVDDAPAKLAQLDAAAASNDAGAIARAAHGFKSSAATIHATALAGVLKEMEAAARTGDAAAALAHLPAVRAAVTAALEQLRNE